MDWEWGWYGVEMRLVWTRNEQTALFVMQVTIAVVVNWV